MTLKKTDCKIEVTQVDYKNHWNTAYKNNEIEKLGWYEIKSEQTLALIKETNLPKNARILNVGIGASTLIDSLLLEGFSAIIANDLAEESLHTLKNRIGNTKAVKFLVDDLLKPKKINQLKNIDLWNDRAVLHFFLKEEEIKAYFKLLKSVLKPNGFVIIAVFAKDGAEKCCGLPLRQYSVNMLQEELGENFKLKNSFKHTFVNPFGGERPYIYTLFQRIQ